MNQKYTLKSDWQNWLLAVLFLIGGILAALFS